MDTLEVNGIILFNAPAEDGWRGYGVVIELDETTVWYRRLVGGRLAPNTHRAARSACRPINCFEGTTEADALAQGYAPGSSRAFALVRGALIDAQDETWDFKVDFVTALLSESLVAAKAALGPVMTRAALRVFINTQLPQEADDSVAVRVVGGLTWPPSCC